MKKLFMLLALLCVLVSSTSCNMLRGAGRDIENVGDSIEHAAR
jgi:predicted small secreted protein